MKTTSTALAILLSLMIASPALAVKVVARSDKQQSERVSQPADSPSTPADPGMTQSRKSDGKKSDGSEAPRERRVSPPPERRVVRENDNFVDENHDGINDRIQKPPEVIKRKEPKHDNGPEQAVPQRQSDREKERQRERDQHRDQGKEQKTRSR